MKLLTKRYKRAELLILILFSSTHINYSANPIFTASHIHTVQLYKTGWTMSYPIIQLNSPEELTVSFDDFAYESKNYQYTIVHCTSDWQESNLMQTEYMRGFMPNPVANYQYSFNTTFDYLHYTLHFPGDDIKLTISGNYLLKIFELGNEKNPVLTRPFYVTEGQVSIIPKIRYSVNSTFRKTMQEINFSILHPKMNINNPQNDIKVVVQQNGRWDNQLRDLKPLFIRDKELVYEYSRENLFDGGNEYRWLDIRSTRFAAEHIEGISFYDPHYHFTLFPSAAYEKSYFYHEDFNGKYFIEVKENRDPTIEADYVYVHFTLPSANKYTDGDLYVTGGLTDWQLNDINKMIYNDQRSCYELTLLLKQGFYNYQYHFLKTGQHTAEVAPYEGNFSQTENDYLIYVYYRGVSDYYDRLIGVNSTNSLKYSVPATQ